MAYLSTQAGIPLGIPIPRWHYCYHMSLFTWPHFHQSMSILQYHMAMLFPPHAGGPIMLEPHPLNVCVHCAATSFPFGISHRQHHSLSSPKDIQPYHASINFSLRTCLTLCIKLFNYAEFNLGKYVHQPSIHLAILLDASATF